MLRWLLEFFESFAIGNVETEWVLDRVNMTLDTYCLYPCSHHLTQLLSEYAWSIQSRHLFSLHTLCTVSSYSDLSHCKYLSLVAQPNISLSCDFKNYKEHEIFLEKRLHVICNFNLFHYFFNFLFNWCTKNKKSVSSKILKCQ